MCGDTIVVEWSTDYGDGRVYRNVSIAELNDGQAIRVTDYWGEPFTPPPWRETLAGLGRPATVVRPLTRGYRVPGEVLDYANRLLPLIAPDLPPATAVRSDPGSLSVRPLAGALVDVVTELAAVPGSIGIVCADAAVAEVARALTAAGLPAAPLLDDGEEAPRIAVVPATLAAILLVVVVGLATDQRDALVRALVAMVVARSFFWVLWFIRSAGMGFGDVRLAAPVGLVLGWLGWGVLAIGLWTAFLAFALPALLVIVVRRDRSLLKTSFPFGPFMVVGALVGLVWGTALAERLWG